MNSKMLKNINQALLPELLKKNFGQEIFENVEKNQHVSVKVLQVLFRQFWWQIVSYAEKTFFSLLMTKNLRITSLRN
jgi:hypothetical protein